MSEDHHRVPAPCSGRLRLCPLQTVMDKTMPPDSVSSLLLIIERFVIPSSKEYSCNSPSKYCIRKRPVLHHDSVHVEHCPIGFKSSTRASHNTARWSYPQRFTLASRIRTARKVTQHFANTCITRYALIYASLLHTVTILHLPLFLPVDSGSTRPLPIPFRHSECSLVTVFSAETCIAPLSTTALLTYTLRSPFTVFRE